MYDDFGASEPIPAAEPSNAESLFALPPAPPVMPPAPPAMTAPPPQPVAVAQATKAADTVGADERIESLKRSYNERLVSLGAAFKDIPHRLSEDGPFSTLQLCDMPVDEVRERIENKAA